MEPASRTPEGESNVCLMCGQAVVIEPSCPPGDAPCPNCGTLLWFDQLTADAATQLTSRGAFIETDEHGQVTSVRFCGAIYDDAAISQLARIAGVQTIDIRDTRITAAGAARLRDLIPDASILH